MPDPFNPPYVGEIRMLAGTFAPEGWADCDGQLLPISGNRALFQIIGTTYGGDGKETFALPDLRGRLPLGTGASSRGGSTFAAGQRGGATRVKLSVNELPRHAHDLVATDHSGTYADPAYRMLAHGKDVKLFTRQSPTTTLDFGAVGAVGRTLPHDNEMPYLVIRFVIALDGVFPSPA